MDDGGAIDLGWNDFWIHRNNLDEHINEMFC